MPLHARQSRLSLRSGFSVMETILVVAVIIILIALSISPVTTLLEEQKVQQEKEAQSSLARALQAYALKYDRLPAELTWVNDLKPFVNYSSDTVGGDIQKDVWGSDRYYRVMTEDFAYKEGQFTTYYALLVSPGMNRCLDGGTSAGLAAACGAAAVTRMDTVRNGGVTGGYNVFQTVNDDLAVKVTDAPDKMKRYQTTRERLSAISSALGEYQRQYAMNALAQKHVNAETEIHVPRSLTRIQADSAAVLYDASVTAHVLAVTGNANFSVAGGVVDDVTRRDGMIQLMKVLGLPEEYCCNALLRDAQNRDLPFFYYSNPMARNATGTSCYARPLTLASKILPARVRAAQDVCE